MAQVLRFPDRMPKQPVGLSQPQNKPQASVLILPCIRREALGSARS